MLVCMILFMCVMQVDRVVTSVEGMIVTKEGSLYVSPLNTAVVRELNVKVGQAVKKGQTLATLDPTFTQADLQQLQERMASDEATVAREEAELAVRPINSPRRYVPIDSGRIWLKRQAQYHSDLANYDGQISSTEAQMSQAKSDADKYVQR